MRAIALVAMVLATTLLRPATAEEMRPLRLEEQVDIADRIVVGRITSVTVGAVAEDGSRSDEATLAVARVLKGPGSEEETLTLAHYVNVVRVCPVSRILRVGDEGVWFLDEKRLDDGKVAMRLEDVRSITVLPNVEEAIATDARKDRSSFALAGPARDLFDRFRRGEIDALQVRLAELCALGDLRFLSDVARLYGSDYRTEGLFAIVVFKLATKRIGSAASWPLVGCLSQNANYRAMESIDRDLMVIVGSPALRLDVPEAGLRFEHDERGARLESIVDGASIFTASDVQVAALRVALANYWTARLTELKIPR